ncbi:MAG TPA: FAD-dependent oxidoreductase [Pseudoxanthomonas sp.]|nr:FAD-dependent oxidoreductase [Pseudoxanthomonas sp.]
MNTLIVFSHLRWDFVYQRPQHLLSRLAGHWPIVVVEEPIAGDPGFDESHPAPGVTVLRPRTRASGHGFDGDQLQAVGALLRDYMERKSIDQYGVWFYTPMALPLLFDLQPQVIVYDCMDELSAFKNAPPQLLAREDRLLQLADIVFTGGPSLYDAKRDRHPNVHCMPSSVDAEHFRGGADPANVSPLLDGIAHPRLGFYGVIDERLDTDLLAHLADSDPQWQVCVVGPVVKIEESQLPRRPNLHYLPQQDYATLPELLAGWDVCLLPFALNDSTRFISPTKTLEYMCAGKPVVSTAVTDVGRLYGSGVTVAQDRDAFVDACHEALAETPEQREQRLARQQALIASTSWDEAASKMASLISGMPARSADRPQPSQAADAVRSAQEKGQVVGLPTKGAPRSDGGSKVDCLILGAGPTGLSAAYHYGAGSLLIDANEQVGGWCRSVEDNGFVFDYAGHIMFSKDPYVLGLYETLLGDNLHWQDREAWVYSKGVHTRYPFQGALYGLPTDVLKECIVGAIEARFGSLDGTAPAPAKRAPAVAQAPAANAETCADDCCADGVVPVDARAGDVKDQSDAAVSALSARRTPRNFEEFIYQTWGAGVAKHFAVPYNLKLWTVPLREMETSWLGGRVPLPDLQEMIDGALRPVSKPVGPNARFGYPLRGGFQALMDGFLPHLRGKLRLNTRITGLQVNARIAEFDDGSSVSYGSLVSTIPLPDLVRMIGDQAPEHVRRAAEGLRHVSVRCVNLGVARAGVTDKHWIYYPEHTVFHRIFVQGNASPHNNPDGGFGLTCEITYSPTKPLPCDGQALIDRCIAECREVGMLREDDEVIAANLIDMPYAYVIYDHARAENVARIRSWLASKGITLAGRYSEWEYYNSDHAFIAGKRAAESVMESAAAGSLRAR